MDVVKYLQAQGIGSRKLCRALIAQGRVQINQHTPPADINPQDVVQLSIDERDYCIIPLPYFYLVLNKPAGYETSHKPKYHPAVFTLLPEHLRNLPLQAIGRLDEDTTGALLITNDGQFNHRISSPKYHIPKTYQVYLKHAADESLCDSLQKGVLLHEENETVCAQDCRLINNKQLEMVIAEGKYHQVKRMIAAAGNRVEHLHRSHVGQLALGCLKEGNFRWISPEEVYG